MLQTTAIALQSILRADTSISAADRARILLALNKPDATPTDKLIRLPQAAELLGVSRRTVGNLLAAGALRGVRFPGRSRFVGVKQSDLTALLENRRIA